MPFPYHLAAIDLDETLLGPDHVISARNARAVARLVEAGVQCVIASGRMHEATTKYGDQLGLTGPTISYNGALVRVAATGEVWHQQALAAGPAARVIDFCVEHGHHLNVYLEDRVYVAERTPWAELYLRQTGSPMEFVGDISRFLGAEPTKLILIDSAETTDVLLDHFRQEFGASVTVMKTNREYLEFMDPRVSKGAALALTAERLGISRQQVVAFGDGHNDIPMVKWAGLGIAMAGAKPEVLAVADRVAAPFEEDGFGMIVEQLLQEHGL